MMKIFFASSAVVLAMMFFSEAGFAQGSCSARCENANSQCQRHYGDLGAACRRQYGSNARLAAECQRQQQAYSNACTTRYRQCLRLCRGR
jgi:hypothetical protein